ncbi:hypothetical protein FACS1894123_01320 [Bacteroidia bacterium]|nr:hypothetical protein FACS1894123_01320 [Bacteroidia bacterium]
MDSMESIKSTVMENPTLEFTRRLFLFSYYCYGISFIDMALLKKKNVIRHNGGDYIVYKRNKTKEAKKVKAIQIKIVPREIISQILGHHDLSTTNTYLDSFSRSIIDEAVKVL